MSSVSRIVLVLLLVICTLVNAGTWLAFNDFDSDSGFGGGVEHHPTRGIHEMVRACKQQQITKRADGADPMCKILLRMTRSSL